MITDFYTVHTQLAYCPKCIGKPMKILLAVLKIFDKKLKERKERFKEIAHQVHRSLEDAPSFENIINMTEKTGIFFIFTNTTRLRWISVNSSVKSSAEASIMNGLNAINT